MFDNKNGYIYSTRTDFERNFCILIETMRNGRLSFSVETKKSAESLFKIRRLPNGRFDLNTIDESARTIAHMAGNFEQMQKKEDHEKR